MTEQSAKAEFADFIKDKGLRQTRQRDKIIDVFLATERHLSVEQLYDLVKRRYKGIGYATVARTVKLMEEAGICRCVDFGDGMSRYEHKFGHQHHDHLICTKCGRLVEIYSPELEELQEKLVRKHNYVSRYHKLDIFGLCPNCKGPKRR